MLTQEEIKELKERCIVFKEKETKVHLTFSDGAWKRGMITELLPGKNFFMLEETMDGLMPVFFKDLADIEPARPKKEAMV